MSPCHPRCVPVDLSSWRARLERAEEEEEEEDEEQQQEVAGAADSNSDSDGDPTSGPRQWQRYRGGVLTLGCVGEGRGLWGWVGPGRGGVNLGSGWGQLGGGGA